MELEPLRDENDKVLENYTVSFDIKNDTKKNYLNFYMGDGTSGTEGMNYIGVKIADDILISSKKTVEKKILLITQHHRVSGNILIL